MSEKLNLTLPFSTQKQQAVLGHCIENKTFFVQCKNKLESGWFMEKLTGKIFHVISTFHEKHSRHPSTNEILSDESVMLEENAARIKLQVHLNACMEQATKIGLDVIKHDMTAWLQSATFQSRVQKSVDLYNAKKIDESYTSINDLVRELRDISFHDTNKVDFSKFKEYLHEDELLYDTALTTGLTLLDRSLIEDGKAGGLLPGDMTVLMAPSNIGKTTVMINMIVANIRAGKNVLFLTHEGTPNDIRRKILCCMLGCTKRSLMEMVKTPNGSELLSNVTGLINQHLTYLPYTRAGMNVEDVEAIIRKEIEMASIDGKKYHMLADDYPAKLGTLKNSRGASPQRITDKIVYNYFTQFCLEFNVHGLVAVQTNREGSKVNKGTGHDKRPRLLKNEDVSESWGVIETATNVITLNRNPEGQFSDQMTFYITKSRSDRVGVAVAAKSDFAKSITHSDTLGSCSYLGDVPMSDKLDSFLQSHMNQQLPHGAVFQDDKKKK